MAFERWALGDPGGLFISDKPVPKQAEVPVRIDDAAICAAKLGAVYLNLPVMIQGGAIHRTAAGGTWNPFGHWRLLLRKNRPPKRRPFSNMELPMTERPKQRIDEERERIEHEEDSVVVNSDESFPAGDPPSGTPVSGVGSSESRKKKKPAEVH